MIFPSWVGKALSLLFNVRPGLAFPIMAGLIVVSITQSACMSKSMDEQIHQRVEKADYWGAVDLYQSVIDANPGTIEARQAQLGLAKLYIEKMYQPRPGIKIYQDILAAVPDSEAAAEAHYGLGLYAFKSKDYQSAQQSFNTIINNFPLLALSYNAQLMLAKTYHAAEDYEKAVEVYGNVANRYPDYKRAAQALVNKARMEQADLRDIAAAEQTYGFIVKRYGNVGHLWQSVSTATQALRLMGATVPEPYDWSTTRFEQQRQRLDRDRPRGTVERSPTMGDAPDYSESGFGVDPELIFMPWKRLMLRTIFNEGGGGKDIPALHTLALMYAHQHFDTQDYRDAGALYFYAFQLAQRKGVALDSSAYFDLAACYRQLGMHQRSAEVLRQGAKKSTQLLEDIIWTGDNQYLDGHYREAIKSYHSVMGVNRSKDPELYWKLGVVHQRLGDYAKEAEFCERAIALKTDYTDALQSLAYVLHYRLNDRDRSVIFDDIANGRGGTYETEKELGAICLKYGNYPQAKRQYEIAARIAQRHRDDATLPTEQRRFDDQIEAARLGAASAAHKAEIAGKGHKPSPQSWETTGTVVLKPAKKRKRLLPVKRRSIYPKNYIPKSQLPSAFFVGLTEDQVIERYGAPVEILDPPPNFPDATKRFVYGDLMPSISTTFNVEGSVFVFGENGVLGYHRLYFGDVNSWVGGGGESPPLLDEIPDALKSSRCDVINEHVLEAARKQDCIVQKAQVVWELKGERWWATVYTTFPVRDFDSNRSIKHYKPQLKDYYIMELLVTDLHLHPDLFLTKPKIE